MNNTTGPSGQIPLPFARFERIDFELFKTSRDIDTVATLRQTAVGDIGRNIYLWGQPGTGKSHLLLAVCTLASDCGRAVAYIPLDRHRELLPEMLSGLAEYDLVCIDDLDSIQGDGTWERSIFSLFNEMRAGQKPLLFTAVKSPKGIGITMPDLKSRLTWDLVYHLLPIDEDTLVSALQLRARSRMFDLPDEVVEFLVKRVARDTHTLFHVLDQLDNASLQSKKKLTVPFVKSILGLD